MSLYIMNNMQMLYFDRIDASKGIDFNKASASWECNIWHYWYFLNKGFSLQRSVCTRYLDLLIIISINLNVILKIKNTNYYCIISGISNSEVINLAQNIKSTEKNGT